MLVHLKIIKLRILIAALAAFIIWKATQIVVVWTLYDALSFLKVFGTVAWTLPEANRCMMGLLRAGKRGRHIAGSFLISGLWWMVELWKFG